MRVLIQLQYFDQRFAGLDLDARIFERCAGQARGTLLAEAQKDALPEQHLDTPASSSQRLAFR
jgi:hypothetical protein